MESIQTFLEMCICHVPVLHCVRAPYPHVHPIVYYRIIGFFESEALLGHRAPVHSQL